MDQEAYNAVLKEREAKRRERDLNDLVAICGHKDLGPRARRQLWRYMALAGVFQPSFDPENPHMTSHNEGKRAVGNVILGDVMAAKAEFFSQMQRESASQAAEDAAWLERQKKDLEENA